MNSFTGLFQSFDLDFEWLLSIFGIQWTLLTDTSSSKAAIRNYGKILKKQLWRSLFLNLIKLNASNCHLIKMDSIRGFSRILSKFHTIRYDLLEFSEHLLMAALIRYGSTCFSEQFSILKNLKKVWRYGLFCCHQQKTAIFPVFTVYQ